MPLDAATALGHLPAGLRSELLTEYEKIVRNYREGRWEAAELDGGRFCEIVYSILNGHLAGDNYPASASKPQRFDQACKQLENADAVTYSDSARLSIPRTLVPLYDVRNRRGVGHVGGDVDANHMDATFVLHTCQWIMAELVRLFHATTVATATAVVETLITRTVPVLWEVGAVTRVLDTTLNLADATLLLLYGTAGNPTDKWLADSLEQDRIANYRRVLQRLHDARTINFDKKTGQVVLSPKGVAAVEDRLLA